MNKKPKIILTRRWPQAVEELLAQRYDLEPNPTDTAFTVEQMQSALQRADAVCPTVTDTLTPAMFAQPVQTRLLANFGAGYNHIPLATALSRGLTVSNTPDVLTDCTADLTLMLLLMTARRAGEGEREVRDGTWSGWRPTHMMGTSVSGKTLGIIGMGRIGRAVARRAQFGFGMQVIYHNRSTVPAEQLGALQAQYYEDLDSMLPHCEFLSLHCPETADTAGLMSLARLQLLPKAAYLVNTSRGGVLDEAALLQALDQGSLAGAGLDVYQGEPAVNPLLRRDDVVLLPHLGSATLETRTAMGMRVAKNLQAFFGGQPVPDALSA